MGFAFISAWRRRLKLKEARVHAAIPQVVGKINREVDADVCASIAGPGSPAMRLVL